MPLPLFVVCFAVVKFQQARQVRHPHSQHSLPQAFAVASLGIATFAGMDVVMKGLALELGAYNAIFWRSTFTIVLAGILYWWQRTSWPSLAVLKLHALRGLIVSIMAFLFFWGLKYLPVAEAIGLSFIAPLIALYLSAVILHEHISKRAILASVIGLIGAVVVIAGRLAVTMTWIWAKVLPRYSAPQCFMPITSFFSASRPWWQTHLRLGFFRIAWSSSCLAWCPHSWRKYRR